MPGDRTVLILTASYGDGHLQVSRALQNEFIKKGVKNVQILDLFAEAHPIMNEFVRYVYLKTFTVAPSLYGWVYYKSKDMEHDRIFAKILHSFGMQKLRKIIKRQSPDVVINTFPFYALPELRLKFGISIPTVTVITDFALHKRWLHSEIEKYYVASEDLKQKIIEQKIPSTRVVVSGIPVRDSFDHLPEGTGVYERNGLDPNKETALVMAGAYGVMRNINKICLALSQLDNFQVVLACGRNESLQREMEAIFAGCPSVKVRGFIQDVQEVMSISSCMITKPGGITLSEAIATGVPTFLFNPVPGQEKDNAAYLEQKGASKIFHNHTDFTQNIIPILKDKNRLAEMKASCLSLQRKKSGERIVMDILDGINQLDLQIQAVK